MPDLPCSFAAVALLAASQIACAHPRPTTPEEARMVRLEVVDRDTGAALPQYRHRREAWVAGGDDQPYTLRLTNMTGARVLVVLSVDGVNVVTGESAHPAQSGYVLAPYASAEIDGWRKSMQEVAAFRFSAAADSYAAPTASGGGRPAHGHDSSEQAGRPMNSSPCAMAATRRWWHAASSDSNGSRGWPASRGPFPGASCPIPERRQFLASSASRVTTSPAFFTSLPMPEMVLHAVRAKSARAATTNKRSFMVEILLKVREV